MKTFLACNFLVGIAAAVNKTPTLPVDSQIGALDFPITCQVPILGEYTFAGYFTATAPNYAASGQEIYYTEVTARVTIPKSITQFAALVGATKANANVKINLALENASPATYVTFPNGLLVKDIPINAGKPATVNVPQTGTLAPIGPITMGVSGKEHVIRLGTINVAVTLYNAQGIQVFGPLQVTCTKQPINYNIGVVNVGPKTGAGPLKFITGNTNTFPVIKNEEETGFFRFPYTCNFGGAIGKQAVDLTVGGTIPAYLAPAQQYFLDDAQAYLNIPTAANAAAKQAYPNLARYKFVVKSFNINSVNSLPTTYNVVKTPLTIEAPYDANAFVLAIPQQGTLRAGPLFAGAAGQDTTLRSGNAAATVSFLDSAGKVLGTSSVTCSPDKAADLIGVPVTFAKPKPITA